MVVGADARAGEGRASHTGRQGCSGASEDRVREDAVVFAALGAQVAGGGGEEGSKKGPRAMPLVPTRELCQQVYDEATSLSEYCGATLRVVQLATTMSASTLKMALARVPDILVATPARITAGTSQSVIQPAVLQESLSMLVFREAQVKMGRVDIAMQVSIRDEKIKTVINRNPYEKWDSILET